MLKELNNILFDVSNVIMQEFADEPEKIGMNSVEYLMRCQTPPDIPFEPGSHPMSPQSVILIV
jgi:hypothetical protein